MSQSQEIKQIYNQLSKELGIDLDKEVHDFMQENYPNGFPDFNGDIIYSKEYWEEFEHWLKTLGIYLHNYRAVIYNDNEVIFDKTCNTNKDLLHSVGEFYETLISSKDKKSMNIADNCIVPMWIKILKDNYSYNEGKVFVYTNK